MSIIDRIKAIFSTNKLNPPEKLVQEVIETAKEEELTDEELASEIVKKLKDNPNHRTEFLKILQEQDEIPLADTLTEVAIKTANTENLPDELAKNIAKKLPDKKAVEVLENAKLSGLDKVEVIDTLSSSKLKEQQICIELDNLYKDCEDMDSLDVERRATKIIGIYKRTERLNQILYKIIAKNFANSYYKFNGGMKVGPLERVIPADEMLRAQIPEMIGQEYERLLEEGQENIYDKEMVIRVFLNDAAKEVIKKAREADRPETAYITDMGTLTSEEQEYFINQLNVYKTNNLTEQETNIALDKLNGIDANEREIQEINTKLKDTSSDTIKQMATLSVNEMEIVGQIISSGLIKELGKENRENRDKYLEGVTGMLRDRKEKEQNKQHNEEEER